MTTLVLAEPVVAVALGAIVLDERIGLAGGIGVVMVVAGLAVLAAPFGRRTSPHLGEATT